MVAFDQREESAELVATLDGVKPVTLHFQGLVQNILGLANFFIATVMVTSIRIMPLNQSLGLMHAPVSKRQNTTIISQPNTPLPPTNHHPHTVFKSSTIKNGAPNTLLTACNTHIPRTCFSKYTVPLTLVFGWMWR
jgi:hypothetical protein